MIEYIVITNESRNFFEQEVNKAIREGFVPQGGVTYNKSFRGSSSSDDVMYAQAMVRDNSKKSEPKPENVSEMKKFVYIEDDQGYAKTPIVFITDAPFSVGEFEKISYEPAGAGRFSTSFNTFAELVKDKGYFIQKIKEYPKNSNGPKNIDVVYGATGNY